MRTRYRKGFIEALRFFVGLKWPKIPAAAVLDEMYPGTFFAAVDGERLGKCDSLGKVSVKIVLSQ